MLRDLTDVAAIYDHRDDARVGGGATDTLLFKLFDESRVGVAGGRLGGVTERIDTEPLDGRTLHEPGQEALARVGGLLVTAFAVDAEEAVELDLASSGDEGELLTVGDGHDLGLGSKHLGGLHLTRDGTLPDQLVELALILVEMSGHGLGAAGDVSGADRLVRLLGVLDLAAVGRGLVGEAVGVVPPDKVARLCDRLAAEGEAIGAHIGDEADRLAADVDAFVQRLRDAHGAIRAVAELAVRILLERGGHEGRGGTLGAFGGLDTVDGVRLGLVGGDGECLGGGLVEEQDFVRPLLLQQPGGVVEVAPVRHPLAIDAA